MRPLLISALIVLLAPAAASAQPARVVPADREQVQLSFAPVVRRVAPAVVNVFTRRTQRVANPLFDDPLFRRFFGDQGLSLGPRERVQQSLGSGVIVAAGGTVVTNHHVVRGADEIRVVLADRREYPARLVRSDERTDLAVLQVELQGETLPYLELRDSDELEVGDLVLAIGNPFGVGQTVTSGIVSGLARTNVGITDYGFFIQTDAAINPGNSGGALVTLDGRLAGINTAIYSRSGGSVGIGFAIPANMVRTVLVGGEGARVVRPWLGAGGQAVTAEIAQSLGLRLPRGVLLNDVQPGSPAVRAGLRVGDIVLEVGGREVDDPESLRFRFATAPLGGTVPVVYLRDGHRTSVSVAVLPPPEDPPRQTTVLDGRHPLAGAEIANLSPALADEIGFQGPPRGVVVTRVRAGSIAHRRGFQAGDVVLEVNGEAMESVQRLRRALARGGAPWCIAVRRGEETLTATLGG
ncbi:Do family serine endopeptidase [Stella sp.]|uniref:Do family serine endopeptidase n=1 Tax=Stella sp. TaxID=2912054 RepID=UPI0035AE09BE